MKRLNFDEMKVIVKKIIKDRISTEDRDRILIKNGWIPAEFLKELKRRKKVRLN